MSCPDEYAAFYIDRLSGPNGDDAWHVLVEAGSAVLPQLAAAFAIAMDRDLRRRIVTVVSQFRTTDALPLLFDALCDNEGVVWQEALDGLVSIGGAEVRRSLADARERANPTKREWLEEAIEQIDAARADKQGHRATTYFFEILVASAFGL